MIRMVHRGASVLAMLLVALFWCSSVLAELARNPEGVAMVKRAIAFYGIPLLVMAMAALGGTGRILAKRRRGSILSGKKKRMMILAANGALLLIPAAWFLHYRASMGRLDGLFQIVQILELAVGLIQLNLMRLNARDGRMLGRAPRQA